MIKKINKGKWRYELLSDYQAIVDDPSHNLSYTVKHEYFEFIKNKDAASVTVKIKEGYRWDGATGLPDLMQTKKLQIPSLVHDVFCQATNENIIKWFPWRKIGDLQFKYLWKDQFKYSKEPYKIRMTLLYIAIRANSIIKGLMK